MNVKKLFRIIGYTFVVLLFLLAISIGMTQTAIFKEGVRQFAEREAAEYLNGEVRIGKISGTFFTGLTLNEVEWWYEDERTIFIESLNITLHPTRLFHNEISVDNIVMMNPEIRLVKDEDGVLNVSRLVKDRGAQRVDSPDPSDTIQSSTWVYQLENLEILGGSIQFINLASGGRSPHDYPVSFETVDFDNLQFENLYLTMSAISDGNNHSIDIRSLNFTMADPSFVVSHFSLQAAFSPGRTQINRLRVMTDRSNVNITGGIADYNILGRNDGIITDKNMNFSVYADRFHFDDLKMFVPAVWFLEGDAAFDMEASGTLAEQVSVEKIEMKLGRSELLLTGTLNDITDADRLYIDASFTDSRIDPADINALLPHYPIPDYSHLGVLDIAASYSGTPRDFNTKLDLHTSVGLYTAQADLNVTGPLMVYDASIVTRNADIREVLQNEYYPYDLSGRVSLQGRGTNLKEIAADAQLAIDHMKIEHLAFDSLTTNVFARNHDIRLISTGILEDSKFTINATGDIENIEKAPFDARLAFESLDLARILQDSSYTSDLTFSLSAAGTGLKPESMLGEIAVELEPSRFREYEFVGDPVYVSLTEIDTAFRELNIRSEIMDVYLAGEFDLPTIVGISHDHVRQLISSIRDDVQGIVTGEVADVTEYVSAIDIQKPLDTVYDIDIKNMDAVAILLGRDEFDIEVEGKLYGYFRAVDDMLHLGGDIEIDHFMYLSDNERILFDKVTGWYNIDNDYKAHGLDGIFSVFNVTASGIYTQSISMKDAQINADIKGPDWMVYSKAVIDTVLGYEVDATAHFDSTSVRTDISTFSVQYGNIDFANRDTLNLRYDNAGVWFESFSLYHNEASMIDVQGLYAFTKEHAIDFKVANVELEEIHRLAVPDAVQRRQSLFNGNINIVGSVGGTTADLTSMMNVRVTDMKYGNLTFGIIKGVFDYNDQRLDFTADVTEAEDTLQTAFRIAGYIPFDILPGSGGERIPDGPMNVHIFSEGFDLSIIDPFLADFRNFRAKMTSDVLITGNVDDPQYEGDLEIFDGGFTFVPNNVIYHFGGKLEPRQNELMISHLRVENRRRDQPDGRMDFSGSVRTRGLTIRDFDLYADGQLMVLRTAARRPGDFFYGDLTVATGANGIRLSGSVEESNVTGTLLIRSANLTFPPARTTAYDRTGSIVSYTVIEEHEVETETLTPLEVFFRDIAQSQSESFSQQQTGSTFIDGLDYDVVVQTDGRVEMTMIFNQATGEELVARIETSSLRLYRDELTGMRLIGNVNIVEPSAYSFYRKFEARGRLSFVGPPDNPEMDITATYTGQRMTLPQTTDDPDALSPTISGPAEPVVVRLHITGDRYEPKLDINLLVNNEEWEGDVETDAISFILTGRFQTDMGAAGSPTLSADFGRGIPATFMSGVATSLLSNLFTEFLRNEVRFIRTAEIVYYGGNVMDTAELRISGELQNFYWTIGGRVFNDIGNTNFSFQIPMGPVFNSDRWTNLFIELERRSQSMEYSEYQRPVNAARLYYSISF